MFTTDRLRLRAVRITDEENISSIFNNDLVAPLIDPGYVVPRGQKYVARILEYAEAILMFCIIEELHGGAFVGFTHLTAQGPDLKNRQAEFGIVLLPEFWSMGYGTEVTKFVIEHGFQYLALHRIELQVMEGNERAVALYRNMGFKMEGRKRKQFWARGSWQDLIGMALLDEEWVERHKHKQLTKL